MDRHTICGGHHDKRFNRIYNVKQRYNEHVGGEDEYEDEKKLRRRNSNVLT
jgi:hypothetical protein